MNIADNLITLGEGITIRDHAQRTRCIVYIGYIMWRGLHKMKDTGLRQDNDFICMTILCLMKFKQIDPDGDREGILVAPRRKRKRVSRS